MLVAATNSWRVYQTNLYSSPGFAGAQDCGFNSNTGGVGMDGGARPFEGYIAELRWSYFNPGEFSVTNLLTRRVSPGSATVWYGPAIVQNPQDVTVWTGGAAQFRVIASTDTTLRYQWQRLSGGFADISGATNSVYVLESTGTSDNGAQFRCVVTKPANSLSVTSAPATVTLVASNPGIVNGYSNAVMSEPSLKAYFPVDGTGTGTNVIT